MTIRVEVRSQVLGDCIFWEGHANQIDDIRSIPARSLAHRVCADGRTRSDGIWRVSVVESVQMPTEAPEVGA
jgi:hypothetical protein